MICTVACRASGVTRARVSDEIRRLKDRRPGADQIMPEPQRQRLDIVAGRLMTKPL